jgi:hypothetical protein
MRQFEIGRRLQVKPSTYLSAGSSAVDRDSAIQAVCSGELPAFTGADNKKFIDGPSRSPSQRKFKKSSIWMTTSRSLSAMLSSERRLFQSMARDFNELAA